MSKQNQTLAVKAVQHLLCSEYDISYMSWGTERLLSRKSCKDAYNYKKVEHLTPKNWPKWR